MSSLATAPPGEAPWERLPDESLPAFEGFQTYRDLGAQRSLVAVGRQLGKSDSLIERWSRQYAWVARSRAYDRAMDRERVDESREAQREVARLYLRLTLDRLRTLDPAEIDVRDLPRWVGDAVRIARLLEGEPTDHVAQAITTRETDLQAARRAYEQMFEALRHQGDPGWECKEREGVSR